jgi:hypothetical protein
VSTGHRIALKGFRFDKQGRLVRNRRLSVSERLRQKSSTKVRVATRRLEGLAVEPGGVQDGKKRLAAQSYPENFRAPERPPDLSNRYLHGYSAICIYWRNRYVD